MQYLPLWMSLWLLGGDPITLADADRFPDPQIVKVQRDFNRHAQRICAAEMDWFLHLRQEWFLIASELRRLDELWAKLLEIRDPSYSDEYRLELLAQLRDAIGSTSYSQGVLPPAVPPQWVRLFHP